MILPGHLAAVYLVAQAPAFKGKGIWWAAMFPDLVDKPLRWVCRVTPNDRLPAHSGLGWLLATAGAWLLHGRDWACSFGAGYGIHLLCDALNARLNRGRVYWLWPFKRYQLHVGPTGRVSSLRDFKWRSLLIEAGLTALGLSCWFALRSASQHPPPSIGV